MYTVFPVAAGNRGVPDDLQKCHAMSKQLQQNQTDIYQRLTVYDGQITNLTQQVSFIFMIYDTRLLDNQIIIVRIVNLLITLKFIDICCCTTGYREC